MGQNRNTTKKQSSLSGLFITFEGVEGSGKSTQCRCLARSLQAQGHQVLETREPGGTPIAESLRTLMLTTTKLKPETESITPACESMLILAARAQHLTHVIQPALAQGTIVLCDRFFDSTLAYQGYARGLNRKFLYEANHFIVGELEPDLTFFLDLPVQDGLARRQRTHKQDRIDQESLRFHQQVRRGFLALAKAHPKRITKMDARQPPQILATQIVSITENLIRGRYPLRVNHLSAPKKKK